MHVAKQSDGSAVVLCRCAEGALGLWKDGRSCLHANERHKNGRNEAPPQALVEPFSSSRRANSDPEEEDQVGLRIRAGSSFCQNLSTEASQRSIGRSVLQLWRRWSGRVQCTAVHEARRVRPAARGARSDLHPEALMDAEEKRLVER